MILCVCACTKDGTHTLNCKKSVDLMVRDDDGRHQAWHTQRIANTEASFVSFISESVLLGSPYAKERGL